jgi:N-acetylglutamate synthase-like GNAT family acetyltransferase
MAENEIEIRSLVLEDVLPVMRVCNQAFLEGARYPRMGSSVVRYVREFPEWQWGAFDGGELLGFLLTEPLAGPARMAIRLIATSPGAQGHGVGGRLVAALEDRARAEGVPLLSVGTPFASGFYQKCGFECTRVHLKMIREIIRQAVPRPEGVTIRTLDYDSAAGLLEKLDDQESRARFLNAFLGNFRQDRGLALLVESKTEAIGVAVGRVSESYRDFVEIAFHRAFGEGLEQLIRSFEFTASTMGLRHVGLALGEDAEETFAGFGYRRAEEDYFWTMYTLEKRVDA